MQFYNTAKWCNFDSKGQKNDEDGDDGDGVMMMTMMMMLPDVPWQAVGRCHQYQMTHHQAQQLTSHDHGADSLPDTSYQWPCTNMYTITLYCSFVVT